jgi:hypothetical protein
MSTFAHRTAATFMSARLPTPRPPLRSALLACAVLFVGANTAWATCGDYLEHSVPAATHDRPATLPMPGPVRCTGPQCRQAPPTPHVPATPLTITVRPDRAIVRRDAGTGAGAQLIATWLALEPDARPVAGAGVGVDHIPRSV